MKTKEIKVYVHKDYIMNTSATMYFDLKDIRYTRNYIEAKLTIEIPDKSVTITESEFDKVSSRIIGNSSYSELVIKQFKEAIGF